MRRAESGRSRWRPAAALAALLLSATLATPPASAATIRAFTPQGEAPVVRQARATFSDPMAALGATEAAAPFDVDCPAPGRGRWIDPRNWVFDFDRVPAAGTRCTFTLKPGTAALDGAAITGATRFTFDTGGPAIARAVPHDGARIDESQAFVLQLTGPVAPASLTGRVWCQATGIGDRIPVRTLDGDDRALLLKRFSMPADRALVLACAQRLPAEAEVSLVWDAGIATPGGLATRRRQALRYQVRPAFQASLSCQREKANAPCTPLSAIRIEFSAPVDAKQAQAVRLRLPGGERAPERDDGSDATVESVTFRAPFPEGAAFSVVLPPGLRDADGRALANAASFPLAGRIGAYPPLAKFAAAPFGIVESMAGPPLVPVTLRRVEPNLALTGLATDRPAMRQLRMQSDAEIIRWSQRLRLFHEQRLDEDELRAALGQPPVTRRPGQEAPQVESRTVGLLAREAGASRIELPAPRAASPSTSTPAGGSASGSASGTGTATPRDAPGPGAAAPADGWPFEVVGVPLPGPGFYVLELESTRLGEALLGRRASMYVRSSALVTNLAVHFKRGREASMAWVTTLDTGRPVAQAQVQVSDCTGRPLWQGRTDRDGLARIDRALGERPPDCDEQLGDWFVSARADDAQGRPDLSFVWSDWTRGIEPWRFDLPTDGLDAPAVRAHTVFDRTLLRAGETVSMKHLVRIAGAEGLRRPPDATLPPRATIVHAGTGQSYGVDLAWKSAAAETVFRLPPGAKLGRYEVFLDYGPPPEPDDAGRAGAAAGAAPKRWWDGPRASGAFRVEAFRLPVLEGRLALPGGALVAPGEVAVQAQLSFVGGGPAAGVPMQVSAMLSQTAPSFRGFDGFTFDREDLRRDDDDGAPQGTRGAAAADAADRGVHRDRLVADRVAVTLDANGAGRVSLAQLPRVAVAHRLAVEGSYTDPAGEIQTIRSVATLWPSAHVVGLRTEGWAAVGRELSAQVAVLDETGRPRRDAKVHVRALLRKTVTHRKRLVGGFYAYEHATQERALGEVCTGATGADGLLGCRFAPRLEAGETGNLLLVAESVDAQGRVGSAASSVWLAGRGELWFEAENHDRMELLPERRLYAPGETAKLQVRMPFRYATAWVAVEREGIVETQVVQLSGRDPTIALKVQPGWGPNVYVSVLAVRGRLREVPWYSLFVWGWRSPVEWFREWREHDRLATPTATVDLTKPTFRIGVAEIGVGIEAQRLKVDVTADKADYPVRGTATITLRATLPDGRPAPAGTEVALAAVDEALLELAPNDSWKLLEAMSARRGWGVETATAQMQVVGRRHYGRKALPAGGDGGRAPARELFDTLLAWHPRLVLDADGRARVDVKLNDSLTRFRIAAVADAGPGFFGTGETTIRATQDLQLVSGPPPVAREGDRIAASVTLRNTTGAPMTVAFEARAEAISPEAAPQPLAPVTHTVALPAGTARTLALPVQVPARATELRWTLSAADTARGVADRVALRQAIEPAVPPTVRAATLAAVDGRVTLPVGAPADALPGRSTVRVTLSPSLAGALDGVRDWFRRYPYTCLEQRASRAVGLGDAAAWQALMEQLPAWLDADGLAQYFPSRSGDPPSGSEVLTAYLLALADEAGLAVPAAARDAMLDGLAAFVEGRLKRSAWRPRGDDLPNRLAALDALARHGRVDTRMLSGVSVDPGRLPTSALLDWLSVLERIERLPRRDALRAQAESALRARTVATGTRLGFAQEAQDRWWWLMASPDGNAARLLLHALRRPEWRDDAPTLMAGLVGRLRQGAWDTTTANAWGTVAARRFAAQAEAVPVAGETRVGLLASGSADAPGPAAAAAHGVRWPADAARVELPLSPGDAGLRITHDGTGRPWAMVQTVAAVPLARPVAAGYRITRELLPVQQRAADGWRRGDIVRVRVTVEAAVPMTWVVISDPLPAGASVLGSGLGRDSAIAQRLGAAAGVATGAAAGPAAGAATGAATGTAAASPVDAPGASTARTPAPAPDAAALAPLRLPTFEERLPTVVRAYHEHLPAGRWRWEYVLRLNQDGDYGLPPTRVEAMYAPEAFGESPNARMRVAP